MEIKQDTRNELFKRQELTAELQKEKTPSFAEVKKELSEELKKPEENIDVYGIKGSFGKSSFTIKANIYDSKEDLNKIKKLQSTSKQRKENAKTDKEGKTEEPKTDEPKVEEAPAEASEEQTEPKTPKEPTSETPTEDLPEQTEEKPKEPTSESPVEERPEEEQKAVEEDTQKEEEAKE